MAKPGLEFMTSATFCVINERRCLTLENGASLNMLREMIKISHINIGVERARTTILSQEFQSYFPSYLFAC